MHVISACDTKPKRRQESREVGLHCNAGNEDREAGQSAMPDELVQHVVYGQH